MEERKDYEIGVVVAYTLEEAFFRISKGELDARGATVVMDNLTNDVRGTRQSPAVTPDELVFRVDLVRKALLAAGAIAVVVSEVKPMEMVDVRPHNRALDGYLRGQGGSGHGVKPRSG